MEGLLKAEPRRRVRVSPLSTEDFEDLYAIRISLESLAVRITLPQLTDAELAEIKLAYLEWSAAVRQGDSTAWRESHRRFHFSLYTRAVRRSPRARHDPQPAGHDPHPHRTDRPRPARPRQQVGAARRNPACSGRCACKREVAATGS
jgi:hypothetical protein